MTETLTAEQRELAARGIQSADRLALQLDAVASWFDGHAESNICTASNWDGSAAENCTHCQFECWAQAIRAELSAFRAAKEAK